MTFTYNLALDHISQVRLEIGDTVRDAGVRPGGDNLQDEEIAAWLSEEDDHVMHTVIRCCLALARMWSNRVNISSGPYRQEYGQIAKNWDDMAKSMTEQYGAPVGSGYAFSVSQTRVDGYSEAAGSTS